ncbi:MAG: PAS domain S-box protein [Candidatus Marinimicrobia bacterium]|nr:PAS domain S-box protein [Candidatus Neomarinimicrobiota bacterium]
MNYQDGQRGSQTTWQKETVPELSYQESSRNYSLKKITLYAAGGSILLAVLGLLGYMPGLQLLGSIGSSFIPMAPTTAHSFIVLGGILLMMTYRSLSHRTLNIFTFLATLVALFGVLEVVGFFLGMDLNFENRLIPEFGTLGEMPIARMSMPTGALFVLAGLAIIALLLRWQLSQRSHILEHLSSGLGMVVLITSLVFSAAYLFGSPFLYGRGSTVPMALTTALAFLALGVSIIAETGGKGLFIWLLKLPFRTNDKPFSAPRRLILLVSVMVAVAMICMSILLAILFRYEFRQREIQLLTSAQNQVLIIETIAEHNITRAADIKDEYPDYDPALATLQEITAAHINIRELGQTIEFTLARQKGDSIVFLQTHRAQGSLLSQPIALISTLAEPQHRALKGETGTLVGIDYYGKEVLAAYSFVKKLKLGVVVKIDMAEIRAPFIRAALTGVIITGIIIVIGSLVFIRIGNPVIRRLEDHSTELLNEINQRKQVERVLSESEAMYRTLFEGVPDAIFFYDPDSFEILNANEATSIIYGYDRDELIGMSCLKFSAEVDKSKTVAAGILKDGQAYANQRHHKKKDGSDLYVNLTGKKISVNGHDLFFSICRDITKHKQAEEENIALEAQLRQSQKLEAIGTMAGGIAHDFNNLLQAQFLYISILRKQLSLKEDSDTTIQHLIDIGSRARDLVNRILTFSRQAVTVYTPLRLQDVLVDSLQLIKSAFPSSISIVQNIDLDAAPVMADQAQVQQVILNLCNNAQQAMGDKNGVLKISLREVSADKVGPLMEDSSHIQKFIELQINDSGAGMNQKTIEKIFDPFYTTKEVGKGTGLGLAVVYGVVKEMNGHISVASKPGKGTTFTLWFPTTEVQPDQHEVLPTSLNPLWNQTVLLVDDEIDILGAGKTILEGYGFDVFTVTNGLDALKKIKEEPTKYQLVITDLTMPKMSGLEFSKEVFSFSPDIPIILATGNLNDDRLINYAEKGIRSILQKPWTQMDLLEKLIELDLNEKTD